MLQHTPNFAHFAMNCHVPFRASFFSLPIICLLVACGSGPSEGHSSPTPDSSAAAAPLTIDLAQHDLPFLLSPPDKQLTGGVDPTVQWKEETGRWEIIAGEHFGLALVEEPADMPRRKADLDRDALQQHSVLKDTTGLLVYRSTFPDDPSLVFVHFYQSFTIGGRDFTAQDLDGMRFNEQDIRRMAAALSPKPPA